MLTYTELLLKIAHERRVSSAKIEELYIELHEWQNGCRRAELYAKWIEERIKNVLKAADDETKARLQREQDKLINEKSNV